MKHDSCVDHQSIIGRFSADRKNRYELIIPFSNRVTGKKLTVIGQNPSEADEQNADKTIRYLERFVYASLPAYDGIRMLNLYTRMDKHKAFDDVLDDRSNDELKASLVCGSDVLLIFGFPRTEKAYRFKDRVRDIIPLLIGVNLFKIAIGTDYPPHPGNPEIRYGKINLSIDSWIYRVGK